MSTTCDRRHSILILDNELGMGGVEKKLYDFIKLIDSKHYRIVICCLKQGGYFKDKFIELGVPFHEGLLKNKYDVFAFGRLLDVIKREDIELIYTFAHPNTMIFATLARMMGRVNALVVSYHAMGSPDGGLLVKPWQRPLLKKADRVLAVANMQKEYLATRERIEAEISVIHNGVDIERYQPGEVSREYRDELGIRDSEVVVTTIASLNPRKRINNLLKAAATILPAFPNTRFLIVGDGQEMDNLTALAHELGISDNITFTGIRDDVEQVLRVSDVFVLPSTLGTETFPNVVLEAMASGVPVITTDVGSVRELIEDEKNGVVIPSNDVDALANSIAGLLDDTPRRARFGRLSRTIVEEKFTLIGMCQKREDLFAELLCLNRPGLQ